MRLIVLDEKGIEDIVLSIPLHKINQAEIMDYLKWVPHGVELVYFRASSINVKKISSNKLFDIAPKGYVRLFRGDRSFPPKLSAKAKSLRSGFTKEIAFYVNPKKGMVAVLNKINSIQTKYIWLISAPSSPDEGFVKHLLKRYNLVTIKQFILANVCLFEKI